PLWQAANGARRGVAGLLETVRQLEGAPIPASILERDVLRARVADYEPWMLDEVVASGEVAWLGHAPLGPTNGRVALYRRARLPLLAPPVSATEPSEAAA